MPGFYITNTNCDIDLVNYNEGNFLQDELIQQGTIVKRNTLDKFLKDKVFEKLGNEIVVTEGVLLNKLELFSQYGVDDLISLISKMRDEEGETFFDRFRGSFSGALYEQVKDEWLIWTNHIGNCSVFYSCANGRYFVGSQVNYIIDALKESNTPISLDEMAVYHMIMYSHMQDDRTYAQEIKRLLPGHYLKITGNSFSVHKYWGAKHDVCDLGSLSESECLEKLDTLFRRAVAREYDKDREYGYAHLSELSGGLDSRAANWVAHELGYSNILNLTISQSNYLDERIAKEIAVALGNDHILKTMDNAKFLFDIDELVMMNAGLALYGHGSGKWLYQSINMNRYGLIHTGLLGDSIVGTLLKTEDELTDASPVISRSHVLRDRIEEIDLIYHQNREVYLLNTVGFLGIATILLPRRNYSEIASPFLDIDFLEFCYSIPLRRRANHKLYREWLINKMPGAAEYVWEREGVPITASSSRRLIQKIVKKGPDKIKRLFGVPTKRQAKGKTMNPYDHWYETNEALRNFMQAYFDSSLEEEIFSSRLREDIRQVYSKGSVIEKTQVLAALGAVKFYFA